MSSYEQLAVEPILAAALPWLLERRWHGRIKTALMRSSSGTARTFATPPFLPAGDARNMSQRRSQAKHFLRCRGWEASASATAAQRITVRPSSSTTAPG